MLQVAPQTTPEPMIKLALCGDVMLGRGVDQILPHPCDPTLYEPVMRSAAGYVTLAEEANGPIGAPVDVAYPWGDALALLERAAPDLRLINLETAVTASDTPWPGKGIHYRMHPANSACLSAAGVDCCTLANNHVLDWGYAGLRDTLLHLRREGIRTAGAGANRAEAEAPAVLEVAKKGRVLVFAYGLPSSGIPPTWAATADRAGVSFLKDLSEQTLGFVAGQIAAARRPGDIVVVSLHWGGNWGYEIPPEHRAFAQQLIARGGADLIFGHSSHHPIGVEIYQSRLILYGCGDLINDYEGIGGQEGYKPDLGVIVLAAIDPSSGRLVSGSLLPVRRRRLRLWHATTDDTRWLGRRLSQVSSVLGTRVLPQADGTLALAWQS